MSRDILKERRIQARRELAELDAGERCLGPESGRVGWVLLWALGVPIPVLLILYFVRGCT